MNPFTPGTPITYKASPDDRETLSATVITVGPGTLTVRLADGTTAGLAIDSTVRRVEQPQESAENDALCGQIQAISAKTIETTLTGQDARKNGTQAQKHTMTQETQPAPLYLSPTQRRDVCAYLREQAKENPRAAIAAWLEVAALELEAAQEASEQL